MDTDYATVPKRNKANMVKYSAATPFTLLEPNLIGPVDIVSGSAKNKLSTRDMNGIIEFGRNRYRKETLDNCLAAVRFLNRVWNAYASPGERMTKLLYSWDIAMAGAKNRKVLILVLSLELTKARADLSAAIVPEGSGEDNTPKAD